MATRRMLWQEKTVSIILWFSLPKKQTWRTRGRDENENAGRRDIMIAVNHQRWVDEVSKLGGLSGVCSVLLPHTVCALPSRFSAHSSRHIFYLSTTFKRRQNLFLPGYTWMKAYVSFGFLCWVPSHFLSPIAALPTVPSVPLTATML